MKLCNRLTILIIAVLTLPSFTAARPPIHEYTEAIEKSPRDMEYKFYLLRGKAHKDSGEIPAALNDFTTSITLYPNRAAYISRGEIYFGLGQYEEAVRDFSAAIAINPSLDLYKLRAESYLKSANYVLALADGLNIIDMSPREAESYYISIEALENMGDISLAREMAFKILAFNRNNKKANEIITKYPLKFIFIGESPVTIYISQENDIMKDIANEIFLRYRRGEKIDAKLKAKLEECSYIGEIIRRNQEKLKASWDNYFDEIRSLKIRTVSVHDDVRNKYQKETAPIERDIERWEDKSSRCNQELIQTFWSNE